VFKTKTKGSLEKKSQTTLVWTSLSHTVMNSL
jgi:hypothetical protein